MMLLAVLLPAYLIIRRICSKRWGSRWLVGVAPLGQNSLSDFNLIYTCSKLELEITIGYNQFSSDEKHLTMNGVETLLCKIYDD